MKSSIKIDTGKNNQPVINIKAYQNWDDLRDKMLDIFLTDTGFRIGGRLCFIDNSGSKNSGSLGEGDYASFSITPIDPNDYELLIEEIKIIIKERESRFESVQHENESGKKSEYVKKIMKAVKEEDWTGGEKEFKEKMNY